MPKRFEQQLSTSFAEILADKRFLQSSGLSKKALNALLREENWREKFAGLQEQDGRFSCAQILDLAHSTLDRLAAEPEEGWLSYCYQYAVEMAFPTGQKRPKKDPQGCGALFLLSLLQVVFDAERQHLPFDEHYDFAFLSETEAAGFEGAAEYRRLRRQWRWHFLYEMMRLGKEVTPYHTLEHIAGVHHLALHMARGLRQAGAPVDLTLISGAAIMHDIGKFGCKPGENVPYLHYYYTDRFCRNHEMLNIGHIAANHSTWDLELELLSVESLLLIYADFRMREQFEDGRAVMRRLSLADSFAAILSKLENVDETKRLRYAFVYAKLHDFEDYMRAQGVDVDFCGDCACRSLKDSALMRPAEVVEAFKFESMGHNIALMHRLDSARLFGNILESARSEKNWKNIRAYINIFEEYFAYLNSLQKVQLLSFLYELLMHREGDIRRRAAGLIGNIIARFHEGYRKQMPADGTPDPDDLTALSLCEKYLEMIVLPDHKLAGQHKSWIGFTLKIVVDSLLNHSEPEDGLVYLSVLMRYFAEPGKYDDNTAFVLLDAMNYLPLGLCDARQVEQLCDFAIHSARLSALDLRTAALRVLRQIMELPEGCPAAVRRKVAAFVPELPDDHISATFLKGRLLRALGLDDSGQQAQLEQQDVVSDIFLDNLKTATPWIIKAINIKILLDMIERGDHSHKLHIAAHLSNLIKVSERVVVRHDAGAALLKVAPVLSHEQRNEIAVELVKGLEVGEFEISKYIPAYLGQFALYLPPAELDELIATLGKMQAGPSERIVSVVLSTIGVLLEHYPTYRARFAEPEMLFLARQEHLLGMLLKGLASHQEAVHQEALLVIGHDLFGSATLAEEEKSHIFSLLFKKMLYLIQENQGGELTFYYAAAALNHIYRFITEQNLLRGGFQFEVPERVAFFPGTFDPFTLSHKGIVQAIRDLGFEVLLAIDEFSWSKKAQPRLIRRQIASVSVADQFHVHIFPDSLPVNLANPEDLQRLREAIPDREVFVVVGSDVVANASSYKVEPTPGSIHHWNHIVFRRASGTYQQEDLSTDKALKRIQGGLVELLLPLHLEDISSTRIRENVDQNRDISHLIDPAAQEFIYQNSLYLREPQYKQVLEAKDVFFEHVARPSADLLEYLLATLQPELSQRQALIDALLRQGDHLIVLRNGQRDHQPAAFVSMRRVSASDLYTELGDLKLAQVVRRNTVGRILLITGVFSAPDRGGVGDAEQLLLTEVLSESLDADCGYALYYPCHSSAGGEALYALLEKQGFRKAGQSPHHQPLYMVDMGAPIVLIQNLETTLKDPFAGDPKVLKVINKAHGKLQTAMASLFPGNLVLSLSASVINQRLIDKITALNGVPNVPVVPRELGPYMCVPFGKILRGKVIPNTVTKTLHTDKVYEPDLQSSSIEAFPYYPPLSNQIRTIKSFMRPVVLVDDLLHGGNRMRALNPLFLAEDLDIRMILVGLLSGYGRDQMKAKGRPVDCVYYVPNLRLWFVESTLYPFIGGDTLRRPDRAPLSGLMPAINQILPYGAPVYSDQCESQAIFELSLTCVENAREILLTLESQYRNFFERNLTLSRLSEAVMSPLCPDKGGCVTYDLSLNASTYLENDIEMLLRTRMAII